MTKSDFDLSSCELEPIHLIGFVQSHGLLLAVDETDFVIQHCSTNSEAVLGKSYRQLVGTRLKDLVGNECCRQIAAACISNDLKSKNPMSLEIEGTESKPAFQATFHRSDNLLIIEIEPCQPDKNGQPLDLAHYLTHSFPELFSAATTSDLLAGAAEAVQKITDFDSVLIYQFDEAWDGTVVAEHRRDFMPSYINQKFPASDIPKQARELYIKNTIRMLVDVHSTPAPVEPQINKATNKPLDLSLAILRSMSLFHIEYLKNMEVSASASVSIIKDGKLWALIVCHHRTPKLVQYKTRAILQFVAELISMQISHMERAQDVAHRLELALLHKRFKRNLLQETDLAKAVFRLSDDLLQSVGAKGLVLFYKGSTISTGVTPPQEALVRLHAWLKHVPDQDLVHTHELAQIFPEAASFSQTAAGLLAIPISRRSGCWIVWFRPEVVRTIEWAGSRETPVIVDPNNLQIHPRKSFELWKEKVAATTDPWLQNQLDSGMEIRNYIREFLLECQVREQMEETRKLAQVVQFAADAIIVISEEGIISSWNTGAERLYGWKAKEAVGQNYSQLLTPEKADEVLMRINSTRQLRRVENVETIHKRKDGSDVNVSQSWSAIYTGADDVAAISVSARDTSEKKEAEKRVSEFYSMVSHELRTPLTSIRASMGLMEGGVAGKLSEMAEKLVLIARIETDRLIRLINDILDIRKIEAGKLDLEIKSWSLTDLVESTIAAMKPMADLQRIAINTTAHFSGKVRYDRDRFIQVLTNLISNAIKFSPTDSEISVDAQLIDPLRLRISVSDVGPGIASDQLNKLFGRFQQLDSSDSRPKGGTGLGLAISKEIVKEHGGTIGVDSVLGKGSTFWFEIPLEASAADQTAGVETARKSKKRKLPGSLG